MNLLQSVFAVVPGIQASFGATGGVAPYSYAVVPGGAGGTINASTGLYTAPASVNEDSAKRSDVIRVTDAANVQSSGRILVGTPLDLLADIIRRELSLPEGRVWVFNQKINEPSDEAPYVVLQLLSEKAFGNTNSPDTSGAGLGSVQCVNVRSLVSIDIKSRGVGARDRRFEIPMALNSDYARVQMARNSFYIARIPAEFTNLSQEDGAAIPYRFNISVNMQYAVKKTKPVPYFSTFGNTELEIEK